MAILPFLFLLLIENKDHLGVIIGIKKEKASSTFFRLF